MSMISSLIDKLNKSADEWNGNNMFELACMCREAADTIWELRDDLQRANAENAKLQNQIDYLMDSEHLETVATFAMGCDECGRYKMDLFDAIAENVRLCNENAKLRELVRDMYSCISHANEADWFHFERDKSGCGMSCTVNGESCGLCAVADRMRELGIEVDA